MQDVRWQQRYANYSKIVNLLNLELAEKNIADFSELEQSGISQWFELSYELLWKLLKDYLEFQEVEIGLLSPKNVLKIAASSGLLEQIAVDGEMLIEMHQSRNELTHIYDDEKALVILNFVQNNYIHQMIKIDDYFGKLI